MRPTDDGIDILRRLDRPQGQCNTEKTCPAAFELSDGSIAVVGTDRTRDLRRFAARYTGIADYERIVVVPRPTFVDAAGRLLLS